MKKEEPSGDKKEEEQKIQEKKMKENEIKELKEILVLMENKKMEEVSIDQKNNTVKEGGFQLEKEEEKKKNQSTQEMAMSIISKFRMEYAKLEKRIKDFELEKKIFYERYPEEFKKIQEELKKIKEEKEKGEEQMKKEKEKKEQKGENEKE